MDALRRIERPFKLLVTGALRLITGSRPVHITASTRFRKILIVRQHNQLGDMLCVIPLLRQLKMSYPGVWISLVASPVNAGVMQNNVSLDEVILYDKTLYLKDGRLRLGAFWRFTRELKARGFDAAIVPGTVSTSFTSDLLAFFSGAPVRIGVRSLEGKENPSGFLFNVARDLDWRSDPHRHQTLRNADILGDLVPLPEGLQCDLSLTREELERAEEWFRSRGLPDGIRIALHPGAGKPPNRWPANQFAEAANVLSREYGATIFITEGPMDKTEVEAVQSTLNRPAQVIKNAPIRDVASILSSMDLVISNDTGVMHVAAAAGVPVVSLFGPTDPLQWAPVGPGNRWIRSRGGLISDIGLEEVLQACRELLGPPRGDRK